MPLPGLTLPIVETARLAYEMRVEQAPAQTQVRQIDETLIIEFKRQVTTLDPRVATFHDGVTATYDVTVVTADRLIIYLDEKRGEAIGNVVLTDPAGRVTAN